MHCILLVGSTCTRSAAKDSSCREKTVLSSQSSGTRNGNEDQLWNQNTSRYISLLHSEGKMFIDFVLMQFEMAVEKGQHSILSHPVMEELIRQKWSRCVRWSFYTLFSLYILFVLSWSLLIAYPSQQEKHRYVFPRDIWRIILIVRCSVCI